ALLFKALDMRLQIRFAVEGLPREDVKFNVESLVNFLVLDNRKVSEALPKCHGCRLAFFHALKVCASLVINARVLLSFLVNSNVHIKKMLNRVSLKVFFSSIAGESKGQESILLAPVAKIIQSDRFKAARLVNLQKKVSNDGAAEVTSVERLGNVWRAKV